MAHRRAILAEHLRSTGVRRLPEPQARAPFASAMHGAEAIQRIRARLVGLHQRARRVQRCGRGDGRRHPCGSRRLRQARGRYCGRLLVVAPETTFGIVSAIDGTVMGRALPRPLLALWKTLVVSERAPTGTPGTDSRPLHQGTFACRPPGTQGPSRVRARRRETQHFLRW